MTRVTHNDHPRVVEQLRRSAGLLADGGARLAFEFVPYSPLRDVGPAIVLCDRVGHGSGLLLDSWHVLVSGVLAAVAEVPGDRIALAQVSDAARHDLPGGSAGRDTVDASRSHRLLPGDGDLDLRAFVTTVRATGFEGDVSTEVLSESVRRGPVEEFVAALRDATQFIMRIC